jgi:metal-responsive CopG/Arc/MetJ family transcriptional regulator
MSEQNVAVIKGEKKKISINIDIDVLKAFNKIAKAKKYNKSQTITNLIRVFVENEKSLIK